MVALCLDDVDFDRRTLMVRLGKGKKDRVLPIGERALAWIDKYLTEARPTLACGREDRTLFLTHLGESIVPEYLTHRVRKYVEAAELGKRGSCHLFRHSMATLMLENGADVRYVQEMLGHANLGDDAGLHPRLDPEAAGDPRGDTSGRVPEAPCVLGGGDHEATSEAEVLLSLAAEAAEEDDDVSR